MNNKRASQVALDGFPQANLPANARCQAPGVQSALCLLGARPQGCSQHRCYQAPSMCLLGARHQGCSQHQCYQAPSIQLAHSWGCEAGAMGNSTTISTMVSTFGVSVSRGLGDLR